MYINDNLYNMWLHVVPGYWIKVPWYGIVLYYPYVDFVDEWRHNR